MYTVVFQDLSSKQFTNMAKAKCEKGVRIVVFPNGGLVYPSNPSISDAKSYRAWRKRGAEKVCKYQGSEKHIAEVAAKTLKKVLVEKNVGDFGLCWTVKKEFDFSNYEKANSIMEDACKEIASAHKLMTVFNGQPIVWKGLGWISPRGEWTPEREKLCKLLIQYFS